MSGDRIVVDTNILIYLLAGDITARNLLRDKTIFISFITEMELKSFQTNLIAKKKIHHLLDEFFIVDMNERIKNSAIEIRIGNRTKLPDAIIAATALHLDIPLLTADKGFASIDKLQLLEYYP